MIRDNLIQKSAGNITEGLKLGTYIQDVINYIEEHLTELPGIYRENLKEVEQLPEDSITSLLLDILSIHIDEKPYRFDKEIRQDLTKHHSPRADLGAKPRENIRIEARDYKFYETFFTMEAKRLTSKLPKNREKEYLVGRLEQRKEKYVYSGGVERFKKCIYGKKDDHGGILGYIQEQDFRYWHKRINSWVDELINEKEKSDVKWRDGDRLIQLNINPSVARYKSVNERTGGDLIILHHLWVNLC